MNIYVFGNPLVPGDETPIVFYPLFKINFPEVTFILTDPQESFPPQNEKVPIIIDTVKGIKKPMLLNLGDFDSSKSTPVSPHDYDLLFHLLLLKKLNKIDDAKIIAVPSLTGKDFRRPVFDIISTLLSKNERRKTYRGQMHG